MAVTKKLFFPVLAALIVLHVNAQVDTILQSKKFSYLRSYPNNISAMVTSPGHWKSEQWFQFGGSVAVVGVMVTMDDVVNIPFKNWQTPFAIKFGEAGDVVGGLPFQFGLTGAALGVGYLSKNKKWQHFALDNLQAQLFTGGITWVIKELTHRARPETGKDNYAWYGPFNGGGNQSFFSGHTSLTFSTATMIFLHSGKKWWVGLLGYGTASAVGISRMQQQKHWGSDVVAGALVGTAVANFIYQQQEKRRTNNARLKPLPD
jgi:membrane-associated phospholipid phosphatase